MATENIKLNFVNRSGDTNNSNIVIFQQNVADDYGERAIAWKVIENCGRLDNHPFLYPLKFEVCCQDSYGNYTPRMVAYDGQAYEMVKDNSGDILQLRAMPASSPNEVEVWNNLSQGSISAQIYKDGRCLADKPNVPPRQKAVFEFHPRIFIGVFGDIEEGDVMDSAVLSQAKTEINLFGITSADIVMTGGGSGKSATAYEFHLENIT